jgi:LEA14-like dessication related protein
MRGRKWLIVLGILALVAVGLWFFWRSPSSPLKKEVAKLKPELSVASVNINDIDEDRISATAKIILKNNLPMEVKTNRLDYVIYIDSTKIIEDSYSKPITIRSSDTTAIRLPMEIMHRQMTAALKRLDNKDIDSADYSIRATFQVDVPIAGERDFTMNMSKRLPAYRLPKVKMGDIDMGKFGLKETSVDMVVHVTNENNFPIKMKDAKYKLTIDNDENVMEGELQEVVNIRPNSTTPVAMNVDMKTMKVPKLGWKMLFDKDDTHFKMNFSSKLISENGILNNSKMAMNMQGTLEELKDAVKKK